MIDEFGDRMKQYERVETDRKFDPSLPIYVRIDGRGFSKFTRDFDRPYDIRMSNAMIDTTKYLVKYVPDVKIGMTQSDEISLVLYNNTEEAEMFFGGKVQKLVSVLASMATIGFVKALMDNGLGEYLNRMPHFDCRVFQLPSKSEAANAMLWREQDARKNAVSMAARTVMSHKEMQGKSGPEMIEIMRERGINFEDYPAFFRQGTFIRKEKFLAELSTEQIARIPEGKRHPGPVMRSQVVTIDMPAFSKVENRIGVVFDGEKPTGKP